MSNKYLELKRKQQEEVNNFPMVFAFSNEQFEEGMKKLGLTVDDTDKVYSIPGGGFIRKTDSKALTDMLNRHGEEMEKAIAEDTTGENFIYEMFRYELNNHEYGYTRDITDTLNSLDLTVEDLNNDDRLLKGLNKAKKEIIDWYNENN